MQFLNNKIYERLEAVQRKYVQTVRETIMVKPDPRPYRELSENEHWALDVEVVGNQHFGHWRVTGDPEDIGRRPVYDHPVRYFYFINQLPKPKPDSIINTQQAPAWPWGTAPPESSPDFNIPDTSAIGE
jgi:hypothetical protein